MFATRKEDWGVCDTKQRVQRCLERMGSEVPNIVFAAIRRLVFKDKLEVL